MAALAAGCVKNELVSVPDREISFQVARYSTDVTTKADGDPVSLLDERGGAITSFSSRAFMHAEGYAGTQDFFGAAGETITWYADTHEWTPSHPYYWPKSSNSYINFVSWYATAGITPTTVSETLFEVTRTVEAGDNLMIADEAWRYNDNAETYQLNSVMNGVPTLFHHVLTRAAVNIRTTMDSDENFNYEVTVQSARLEGVYQSGTMRLVNSDLTTTGTKAWTPANAEYMWNTTGTNDADITILNTDTNISSTSSALMAERSFVPQPVNDDMNLVITFTVTTKSGNTIVSQENNVTVSIKLNTIKNSNDIAIDKWVPNKIYTYNIAINPAGNEILLNPSVSDWGYHEDYSITVEE